MVTKKTINGKSIFVCDICGLGYLDKETAQKCEDYCRAHAGSCIVEITKKAIYFPDMPIFRKEP
jgi:hypothetical protein